MNSWLIAIAIVLGSIVVAGAVVLRPSDFDQCTGVISSDIERSNPSATLDPRDVRAQAARICAGYEGP